MTPAPDPWALPGLARWLDALCDRLFGGAVVLTADTGRPPGVLQALRAHLPMTPVEVCPTPDQAPATALAGELGAAATLEGLLIPALDQELVLVVLEGLGPGDLKAWSVFLERYTAARADGKPGPALLFIDPPEAWAAPELAVAGSWRSALRRGDLVIWAEEHLPAVREGLAAELAVALAVELCGWRLDLAAALARAAVRDLAAPLNWLAAQDALPITGGAPPCPLARMAEEGREELQRRVWKAQLIALFPALEEFRLEIVSRHRNRLRIDEHLRGLGVHDVDEIELGALGFQLQRHLTRPEADRLRLFARARNQLAHRRPVDPEDALRLLAA